MFTEEDAIQHSCCRCCCRRCCCYCLELVCIEHYSIYFRPFIIWRHTAETCQCVHMSTMNHSLSHRISMISTKRHPSIHLSLPLPSSMSFNICFTSHTFCRHQIYESVRILWDDWFRFSFSLFIFGRCARACKHLAVLSIHYIPHHTYCYYHSSHSTHTRNPHRSRENTNERKTNSATATTNKQTNIWKQCNGMRYPHA